MTMPSILTDIGYFVESATAARQRHDTSSVSLGRRVGMWTQHDIQAIGAAVRDGGLGVARGDALRDEAARALYDVALSDAAPSAELQAAFASGVKALERARGDWRAVKRGAEQHLATAGPVAAAYGF